MDATIDVSPKRTRKDSSGSDSTVSSGTGDMTPVIDYSTMEFEDMLALTDNMDTEVFENTRKFNPRKHRSCHRRSQPVSENQRKFESSKNSREYTKRNRDEIKVCQRLNEDIEAKKVRWQQLIKSVEPKKTIIDVKRAVIVFEEILRKYTAIGYNIYDFLNIPNPECFLDEYRKKAAEAEALKFETGIESYEQKLQELHEQFAALSSTKEALNSQKDKTNYASSKSRLKQRIVRAQLKTSCWKGWNAIETMRLQGRSLKECAATLKRQVWNAVLAVYDNLLKVVKIETMSIYDRRSVELIHMLFEPFSKSSGVLTMNWVPKTEIKEEEPDEPEEAKEPKELKKPKDQMNEVIEIKVIETKKEEVQSAVTSPMSTPKTKSSPYSLPKKSPKNEVSSPPAVIASLSSPTHTLALPIALMPKAKEVSPSPLNLMSKFMIVAGSSPMPISPIPPSSSSKHRKSGILPITATIDKTPTKPVDNHDADADDEEFVDVETITELSSPRKRNSSATRSEPVVLEVEPKKLKFADEDVKKDAKEDVKVTVEKTGFEDEQFSLQSLLPPQPINVHHSMMIDQCLLPPPLVINPISPATGTSTSFQQMMINSPFFNQMLTPSPEMLNALKHQKQIQMLLHEKFSRIKK